MDTQRRDWLKRVSAGSAIAVPGAVLSDADASFERTMGELVGSNNVKLDSRIKIHMPVDAANGAVVPIGVESAVPGTLKIVVLVDNHQHSKIAQLDTSSAVLAPRLSTHLQLQHAATVTVLVETRSGWHSNSTQVKTLGESC